MGAVGNNTASSAQSKHAREGAAGGGCCNTVVAGGSEVLVVLENMEGRDAAHSQPCWEWLGCTSHNGVVDGGQRVSTVVNNVTNDVGGVWGMGGVETVHFQVPEASRGDGAGPGGVLRVQVGCFMLSELWAMVQNGAEMGIWPLLTDMLLMTC